jgi:predicted negative regulator of RcsB-dependent stress response
MCLSLPLLSLPLSLLDSEPGKCYYFSFDNEAEHMKKKEREHLKEDPLKMFVKKILTSLRGFKKELMIGGFVLAAVLIVIMAISILQFFSAAKENTLYSEGLKIKNSTELKIDAKIERLKEIESKSGVSAANQLLLASLYFEKGDIEGAQKLLADFPKSSINIINQQKKLIDADILAVSGKVQEGIDMLNKMLADSKSEVAKDFLLLKIARFQVKAGQEDAAKSNLNRLTEEFPQSMYSMEARNLLETLK